MTFLLRCDTDAEAVSKDVARAITIFFNKSAKSKKGYLFTAQEAKRGDALQASSSSGSKVGLG